MMQCTVLKVSRYIIKLRLSRIPSGRLISFVLLLTMQHIRTKVTLKAMAYNAQALFRHSDITSSVGGTL